MTKTHSARLLRNLAGMLEAFEALEEAAPRPYASVRKAKTNKVPCAPNRIMKLLAMLKDCMDGLD